MHETETFLFGPVQHPPGVLVVEDDDTLRGQLGRLFEDEGYVVSHVKNGAEAFAYLMMTPTAQVVLLDWQMPAIDGIELLATLSQNQQVAAVAARHTYLLLTAWYDLLGDRLKPFAPYLRVKVLRKPFELDDLLGWVAQAAAALSAIAAETTTMVDVTENKQ